MRIVYLGSPQDSVYPLEYLIENKNLHKHEIVAVVSQSAKLGGRGRDQKIESPLTLFAQRMGILTLQPDKASDQDFQKTLRQLSPDLMITCAYGQILNQDFLDIPKRATINIHPSLLPRYRGATPVQTALLDGLKETGVTILFTVKALDAGNMILQEKQSIRPHERAGDLMTRLFKLSGPLLIKAIDCLEDPNFKGTAQNPDEVSLCKKIHKEDGRIDWNSSCASVMNRFRAFDPWPGCFTFLHKKRILLTQLEFADKTQKTKNEPGTFSLDKGENALYISCIDASLKLTRLKPEGSRELSPNEFWNGLKNRTSLKFTPNETEEV